MHMLSKRCIVELELVSARLPTVGRARLRKSPAPTNGGGLYEEQSNAVVEG